MSQNEADTIKAARDQACEIIKRAQAELLRAAAEIAERHGIPEAINGLTAGEYLGRISFVVSMSRDLRAAGEAHLARDQLSKVFQAAREPARKKPDNQRVDPPANKKAEEPEAREPGLEELSIHPNQLKALKGAGVHHVADLDKCTDEFLLGLNGIAPASLAKIREARSKFQLGGSPLRYFGSGRDEDRQDTS